MTYICSAKYQGRSTGEPVGQISSFLKTKGKKKRHKINTSFASAGCYFAWMPGIEAVTSLLMTVRDAG